MSPDTEDLAAFLGGFTAAEGCFTGVRNGSRFTFAVGLGASDRDMCTTFNRFMGAGHITDTDQRQPHHDDQSTFAVGSAHDLIGVIVPFMDEHLPPSYKREQYLDWRTRLFEFWDSRARRAWPSRQCAEDGCGDLPRAKGLCRRHYYQRYGR